MVLCARAGLRPRTLVEIGCGDGALLAELGDRGLAPVLDGFELSPPAAELARARTIPGARRIEAYDGEHVPAPDAAYDLAVLSHVLEHVEHPAPLLREAARVAPAVLVEVPLEANRSAARPPSARRPRASATSSSSTVQRCTRWSSARGPGHRRRAQRPPPLRPPRVLRHLVARPARAALKACARRALWRVLPQAAERLFTVHYACVARRR